ncbi:hypothetical protein AB6A40_001916 [Gnathostoma spinigerum]|uniref:DC-STAMP domain-containing protein 1 n=1 Tax=Gnathostoma spinigerum TaxID=75299 RepID=A0ABD6E7G5_9BILA
MLCVLVGALGKNGQGMLSVYVFSSLADGPIAHIISNFNITSHVITCHLKIQEEMLMQQIISNTGAIESFLSEKFGEGTKQGSKVIALLKALAEPLSHDQTLSEEDEALAATIDSAEVMGKLNDRLNTIDNDKIWNVPVDKGVEKEKKNVRPIWAKFKAKTSKLMALRLNYQCNEIFDKGIKVCSDKFADMKDKCYDTLWYLPWLNNWFCGHFDTGPMCQSSEKHAQAVQYCDTVTKESLEKLKNYDAQSDASKNISDEILDQLRVQMHYKAIEEPRITRVHQLKEVGYRVNQDFRFIKAILRTIKQTFSCLLIFMIYTLFRDSIVMIRKYLNDINFNNVFLTPYFYEIDAKRKARGQVFLVPLSRAERKRNGLLNLFSPPTRDEVHASWMPFSNWFVTFTAALVVVIVDVLLHTIIEHMTLFSSGKASRTGTKYFSIQINGTGFVAALIQDLLNFKYDHDLNYTISTENCIIKPQPIDWYSYFNHIFFPLGLMLVLQVIFGFVIKRMTLFYIIGNIFRKRSKARIIQLYNKLLFGRVNERTMARARIRYQVQRRILQENAIREQSRLFAGTFFGRWIIDAVFKTGKCLICESPFRKKNLVECPNPNCPATYCRVCYDEFHQQCYACLAEEGVVTSARTQFRPLPISHPQSNVKVADPLHPGKVYTPATPLPKNAN